MSVHYRRVQTLQTQLSSILEMQIPRIYRLYKNHSVNLFVFFCISGLFINDFPLTSIFSQLQQRGVPSCSCEGQYFWGQNGCALYSILPPAFAGIYFNNKRSYQKLPSLIKMFFLHWKWCLKLYNWWIHTYKILADITFGMMQLHVARFMVRVVIHHRELKHKRC